MNGDNKNSSAAIYLLECDFFRQNAPMAISINVLDHPVYFAHSHTSVAVDWLTHMKLHRVRGTYICITYKDYRTM